MLINSSKSIKFYLVAIQMKPSQHTASYGPLLPQYNQLCCLSHTHIQLAITQTNDKRWRFCMRWSWCCTVATAAAATLLLLHSFVRSPACSFGRMLTLPISISGCFSLSLIYAHLLSSSMMLVEKFSHQFYSVAHHPKITWMFPASMTLSSYFHLLMIVTNIKLLVERCCVCVVCGWVNAVE